LNFWMNTLGFELEFWILGLELVDMAASGLF